MPVVKADGYGHGATHVARRLAREGAPIFAVAVVEEGLELRRAGIKQPILVMGWIGKEQLGSLVEAGLTPNVHSLEQAGELKSFLEGRRRGPEGETSVPTPPPPPPPPPPPRPSPCT
jgi:alanine racemase